jgi:hypothetical protein
MNRKLTLNINDTLIQFAHSYSKETHQSISSLVEKYFQTLKNSIDTSDLTTATKELYGILSLKPVPDKKVLREEFHEKSIS